MRLYLSLLFACVGTWVAHADEQVRTMQINTTSSEVIKIPVSTQTRITFSKDLQEMTVSEENNEATQIFRIDEIADIIFTIDSTSTLIEVEQEELRISHFNSIVTISGADKIEYGVWSLGGILMLNGNAEMTATLDLSNLPSATYIIKANNTTIKFIKH